jgi:two-component system cell cycle response regulator
MGSDCRPIIVVEDDSTSRKLLTRYLEKAGYSVQAYPDARAATQAILDLRAGVIIADWNMPGMSGLELVRFVRGMEEMKALDSIYFILMTASGEKDRLVEGLLAGADDFLAKPYHREELLARLKAGERIVNLQAELLSRQAELARANLDLEATRRKLEQMASTDMLTGMYNRRALFERFVDAFSVSQRHGRPLSCIMLDVDHFKRVNDTYGHSAGDAVLRTVGQVMCDNIRRHDTCGRLGGEEFCVVCPETPLAGAAHLAERLRQAIAAETVKTGDVTLHITASFGVATRHPADTQLEMILDRADAMLYRAKDSGRNQVWSIDPQGRMRRVSEAEMETPVAV